MSHPERYTEQFMCKHVVHPLLTVLCYLHDKQVIHRCVGR